MAEEQKNTKKSDNEFSFIQQEIKPRKKSKFKKFAVSFMATVIFAVVFGLISRYVFRISEPLFNKIMGIQEQRKYINFTSILPDTVTGKENEGKEEEKEPEPTEEAPTVDEKEEEKEKELSQYINIYTQINRVAEEARKSIVTVTSIANGVDWFENIYEQRDIASGLILSDAGDYIYILANKSRIKDASNIRVTFSTNETVEAVLINSYKELDFSILAIDRSEVSESTLNKIKVAVTGRSYSISTGEPIIALGSPNGYPNSMELGIVTNKFNYAYIVDNKVELFNTDINDNQKGTGVIINMKGEVIGFITQNFKDNLNKNINTNITISEMELVFESLVNNQERIYFGVIGADMTPEIHESYDLTSGIYITEVEAESPAFEAGIQAGDIIMKVNDTNINSVTMFNRVLQEYSSKDSITVTVKRTPKKEDNIMDFEVELGAK